MDEVENRKDMNIRNYAKYILKEGSCDGEARTIGEPTEQDRV